MWGYQSLKIQGIQDFHASHAKIRVLSANNRGGKSTRGAWELVCFATGYHPIRKEHYNTPNICWAVSLDNKNYGHIVEERLREWLPAGTEWRESKRYFQLPKKYGGSRIYLKSAEPGETKFAAEGLLAAWFDEGRSVMEKPFQETLARLKPGQPLRLFITMTPEDGIGGWTWPKFYNPTSRERYRNAEVFYFTMYECDKKVGGHLTTEEIEDFVNQFPEWLREAKVYGRPGKMSSNPYFRLDHVNRVAKRCDSPRYGDLHVDAAGQITFVESDTGNMGLFRPPVGKRRYLMPTDVGGGVGRDYTVAAILDPADRAEVAFWRSNVTDVESATRQIITMGRYYNKALAIPETNGEHGAAHLSILRDRKYGRIYRRRKWHTLARKYLDEYGWRTNEFGSRNMIHDAWARTLREDEWTFSAHVLDECRFISELDGRPDHPKGMNDDHFIAVGVGLAALQLRPEIGRTYQAPQQPRWSGEDAYQYAI